MARNSDYPLHVGSTDGGYALMAVDLGGGAFRLRWVHTETLGFQGPVGISGQPGEDNFVVGEKGDKGLVGSGGPTGPTGVDGVPGQSAEILQPNIYLDDGFAIDLFEDYADGQSSGFNAGRGWSGNWQTSNASIVTRISHNGIVQKRLSLVNGEIGRTFRFGSRWNKLQIGILARINSPGAVSAMNYYAGVCSGTANMASSATCANFIGLAGSVAGTITWSTLTFAAQNSLNSSATVAITRRVNTNTLVGNSSGLVLPSTEGTLGVIWLQFIRAPFATNASSVTYNHRIRAVGGGSPIAGMSMMKEQFINSLHNSLGGADSFVGSLDSTFTPAFDQSTGALDTFNFFWDSATPIEIAGVAIRKVF